MPKHRGHTVTGDPTAAHELELYADNESSLYPMKQAIAQNLAKKAAKGTYDASKGAVAWGHWYEAAAKKYCREFGGTWSHVFSAATRRLAAKTQEAHVRQNGFEV